VLVITSGDRRVDEKKVEALVGKVGRADADFVRLKTGFAIGGVSPIGHASPPVTLIDRELFRFEEIWAAAGHPHGVFQAASAGSGGADRRARGRRGSTGACRVMIATKR
jgi:prolyl-tRNA editing enzyme YbaK/EbsC (Cys-tRNA(Pro) deacylase)